MTGNYPTGTDLILEESRDCDQTVSDVKVEKVKAKIKESKSIS